MSVEEFDIKEFLLFALKHFSLEVAKDQREFIYLEGNYTIEIEGSQLFRLLQGEYVISSFADVEELCDFIQQDRRINEKG